MAAKKTSSPKTTADDAFDLAISESSAKEELAREALLQTQTAPVAEPRKAHPAAVALEAGPQALRAHILENKDAATALVEGTSLLLLAVVKGDLACVAQTLSAGADPSLASGPFKAPPITACADKPEIMEALAKAGADVNATTDSGLSALTAVLSRLDNPANAKCLEILKLHGAKPTVLAQWPTILSAVQTGDAKIVEWCLANGSSVDDRSNNGLSALHVTAGKGLVTMGALLISKGANPNATTKDGSTPLHFAAASGKPDAVKALLAAGTNPQTKDSAGKTAFASAKDKETRDLLPAPVPTVKTVKAKPAKKAKPAAKPAKAPAKTKVAAFAKLTKTSKAKTTAKAKAPAKTVKAKPSAKKAKP